MNTLVYEMEARSLLLIVEHLKFHNPLNKVLVSEFELGQSNHVLIHDSDTDNELAVVTVIYLRE